MASERESFTPKGLTIASEQHPNQVVVDLDNKDPNAFEEIGGDDDLEIEVIDDTPEADRGRPSEVHRSEADEPPKGGRDAESRIKRLKYETNAERRLRETAERQLAATTEHAQRLQSEVEDLRRRTSTSSTALAASMKAEREGLLNDAKRRLSAAHADGDSDAIATATSDISRAQSELMEIQRNTPREIPEAERRAAPTQQVQRAAPTLEPNVVRWIADNPWFGDGPGKDVARTRFAISVDQSLRARGVDPHSDAYLRELDKGVKAVYSDHKSIARNSRAADDDEGEPQREVRRTNVQEQGGRVDDRRESARKVTLTASELEVARKLRITPQAYAAEKLKAQRKAGAGA